MTKKSRHPNFDQTLEILRAHSFDVSPYAGVAGGFLVSKDGVGAVLVAHEDGAAMAVTPGALVRGEVARLLDRGYQKFIKTSQFELPASASQLQAIHLFSEELKLLTGATSLYNESLGHHQRPVSIRPPERPGSRSTSSGAPLGTHRRALDRYDLAAGNGICPWKQGGAACEHPKSSHQPILRPAKKPTGRPLVRL